LPHQAVVQLFVSKVFRNVWCCTNCFPFAFARKVILRSFCLFPLLFESNLYWSLCARQIPDWALPHLVSH